MSIAEKYAQLYMPNGEVSLADLIQSAIDETVAAYINYPENRDKNEMQKKILQLEGEKVIYSSDDMHVVGWILMHENGGKNLTFHDNTGELSDGWTQYPLIIEPSSFIKSSDVKILQRKAELAAELEHTLHHLNRTVKKLSKYKLCMSYNDSYFGEPEGEVKRVVYELSSYIDIVISEIDKECKSCNDIRTVTDTDGIQWPCPECTPFRPES